MRLALRVARLVDLHAILDLERSTPELPHWSEAEYERYVPGAAASDRVLFVAEAPSGVAGFAAAALTAACARMAELENIAVRSDMRRSGIGRELCQHVIDWSRVRADSLELEVRSRNSAAIALYDSLGFNLIRTRPRYYANPVDDALLLSRML